MEKVVLPNGLTVIYEPKKGNSVVVEVLVKVGSNLEAPQVRGISHFIEHMLFEGTKKRPTNHQISNEIERIGGEFNAYTSNERTCFYVKVLKKHFSIAVDVLADIMQNSLFKEEDVKKEKNVILKEIDLVNDEPRYYQWVLLNKNLFEKHPTQNPVYGEREAVKKIDGNKIKTYFEKYYIPNNMTISIVGEVKDWRKAIETKFTLSKAKQPALVQIKEPVAKKNKIKVEKKNIANTYMVMGFKTVPKGHPDYYPLEVVNGILGRGQSGKVFTEIRSKRGLAYEVGTQNVADVNCGYFAVFASIDKKNLELVKKLILEELEELKAVSGKDLQEAQDFIEGDYLLDLEDGQKLADELLFWEQTKDAHEMKYYLGRIKKVSSKDIKHVIEKYFKNYTMVVLKGK